MGFGLNEQGSVSLVTLAHLAPQSSEEREGEVLVGRTVSVTGLEVEEVGEVGEVVAQAGLVDRWDGPGQQGAGGDQTGQHWRAPG